MTLRFVYLLTALFEWELNRPVPENEEDEEAGGFEDDDEDGEGEDDSKEANGVSFTVCVNLMRSNPFVL